MTNENLTNDIILGYISYVPLHILCMCNIQTQHMVAHLKEII